MSLAVDDGNEAVSPIGKNIWAISSSDVLETTIDGGSSWLRAVQPSVSDPAVLSRVNTSVAYVLGCGQITHNDSQPGDLARTDDGGKTWQTAPLPQGCPADSARPWDSCSRNP
jgi:photosystem II stability/assembly factor-like uncharacterized protein